jgi:hypothetical protein
MREGEWGDAQSLERCGVAEELSMLLVEVPRAVREHRDLPETLPAV